MTKISVIIPVYNVEKYITQSVESVLNQSFQDFELIIVDDESPDQSIAICESYQDPRIRIVHQHNLGLAGARNTGIEYAVGEYVAFLDGDDYWAPKKLESHLAQLESNPKVGVSYCPSNFIDDSGNSMGIRQNPKLKNISIEDIFCRNPIGNGSSPVIRKEVFDEIAFKGNSHGIQRNWYFDETFKQSEDIECWLRIASQTHWQFEGIAQALTYYRVNESGLSANVVNQFDSWKRAAKKLQVKDPDVFAKLGTLAESYQLRYLARRAIRSRNPQLALKLALFSVQTDFRILLKEPKRTINTLLCASLINLLPQSLFCWMESFAMNTIGLMNSLTEKLYHKV
jgi:glycosyltransferase involved in cell wall biosynthesis